MASLRPARRSSLRFAEENARINEWLRLIAEAAPADYAFACEIAGLQRLIKGYGETHERGLGTYGRIIAALAAVKREADPAAALYALRDAALQDEDGKALARALARLGQTSQAA